MLSKRERRFAENPSGFADSVAKDLRYKIKQKLKKASQDLDIISKNYQNMKLDPSLLEKITKTKIQNSPAKKKHEQPRSQNSTTSTADRLVEYEEW